jgi:hypothetical protein
MSVQLPLILTTSIVVCIHTSKGVAGARRPPSLFVATTSWTNFYLLQLILLRLGNMSVRYRNV